MNALKNSVQLSLQLKKTFLFLITSFPLSFGLSFAQQYKWIQTSLDSVLVHDILIYDSIDIYAAANNGIYFTSDYGDNWIIKNNGLFCEPFKLIRDNSGNLYTAGLGGIFKSTNQGDFWFRISDSFATNEFYSIALTGSETLLVSCFLGIFYSTDYGNSWFATNYTDWGILEIISFSDSLAFAASNTSQFSGIFISTNDGRIWNYNIGLSTHTLININDSLLFCGSQLPIGIYVSADTGGSWNPTNHFQDAFDLTDLLIDKNGNLYVSVIYPGCNNFCDVYKSKDLGLSWTQMGLNGIEIYALAADSLGTIYAGSNNGGVYKYDEIVPVELISFTAEADNDKIILNWVTATEINNLGFEIERKKLQEEWKIVGFVEGNGTTSESKYYNFIDKDLSAGKYYYRLKQIDYDGSFEYSNIIEVLIDVPEKFELYQNYPNPFNPETTIKYSLKDDGFVSLKIYNILGSEIAALVNEQKIEGEHSATFNFSNLASGTYFYVIRVNDFTSVKKMMLLK